MSEIHESVINATNVCQNNNEIKNDLDTQTTVGKSNPLISLAIAASMVPASVTSQYLALCGGKVFTNATDRSVRQTNDTQGTLETKSEANPLTERKMSNTVSIGEIQLKDKNQISKEILSKEDSTAQDNCTNKNLEESADFAKDKSVGFATDEKIKNESSIDKDMLRQEILKMLPELLREVKEKDIKSFADGALQGSSSLGHETTEVDVPNRSSNSSQSLPLQLPPITNLSSQVLLPPTATFSMPSTITQNTHRLPTVLPAVHPAGVCTHLATPQLFVPNPLMSHVRRPDLDFDKLIPYPIGLFLDELKLEPMEVIQEKLVNDKQYYQVRWTYTCWQDKKQLASNSETELLLEKYTAQHKKMNVASDAVQTPELHSATNIVKTSPRNIKKGKIKHQIGQVAKEKASIQGDSDVRSTLPEILVESRSPEERLLPSKLDSSTEISAVTDFMVVTNSVTPNASVEKADLVEMQKPLCSESIPKIIHSIEETNEVLLECDGVKKQTDIVPVHPIVVESESGTGYKCFNLAAAVLKKSGKDEGGGRTVKCVHCSNVFNDHQLSRHERFFSKYVCPLCNVRLCSKKKLTTHITQHLTQRYQCCYCFKTFATKSLFARHRKLLHSKKKKAKISRWECMLCRRHFPTSLKLIAHQRKCAAGAAKNDESLHRCNVCQKVFLREQTMEIHQKLHKVSLRECVTCEECFDLDEDFQGHECTGVQQSAFIYANDASNALQKKYQTQRRRGSAHSQLLKKHLKFSFRKKTCFTCASGFKSRTVFNEHIQNQTCSSIQNNRCMICKGGCRSDQILKHITSCFKNSLSSLLKPAFKSVKRNVFHCSICNTFFPSLRIFKLHTRLFHAKDAKLSCNKCGFRAYSTALMAKHVKKNLCPSELSLACFVCEAKRVYYAQFGSLAMLVAHLSSHNSEAKRSNRNQLMSPVKITSQDQTAKFVTFNADDAKKLFDGKTGVFEVLGFGKYHIKKHAREGFVVDRQTLVNLAKNDISCNETNFKSDRSLNSKRNPLTRGIMSIEHRGQIYVCHQCDVPFFTEKGCLQHINDKCPDAVVQPIEITWPCCFCKRKINPFELESHCSSHAVLMLECYLCNLKLSNKAGLVKHLSIKHNASWTAQNESWIVKIHKQANCDVLKAVYHRSELLLRDMPRVDFKCEQCCSVFYHAETLSFHCKEVCTAKNKKPSNACTECKMEFPSQTVLQNHCNNFHSISYQYNCLVCGQLFSHQKSMTAHLVEQHHISNAIWQKSYQIADMPVKSCFKCVTCSLAYSSEVALSRHMFTHLDVRTERCHVCLKTFGNVIELKLHVYTRHKCLFCECCHQLWHNFNELYNHCQLHVLEVNIPRDENGKMIIEVEDEPLKEKESLFADCVEPKFRVSWKIPKSVLEDDRLFYCYVCRKNVEGELTFIVHMKTHPLPRKLVCLVCDNSFDGSSELETHLSLHFDQSFNILDQFKPTKNVPSNEPNVAIKCTLCSEVFGNDEELNRHTSKYKVNKPKVTKKAEETAAVTKRYYTMKKHGEFQMKDSFEVDWKMHEKYGLKKIYHWRLVSSSTKIVRPCIDTQSNKKVDQGRTLEKRQFGKHFDKTNTSNTSHTAPQVKSDVKVVSTALKSPQEKQKLNIPQIRKKSNEVNGTVENNNIPNKVNQEQIPSAEQINNCCLSAKLESVSKNELNKDVATSNMERCSIADNEKMDVINDVPASLSKRKVVSKYMRKDSPARSQQAKGRKIPAWKRNVSNHANGTELNRLAVFDEPQTKREHDLEIALTLMNISTNQCKVCEWMFECFEELKEHAMKHVEHATIVVQSAGRDVLCVLCYSLVRRTSMRMHLKLKHARLVDQDGQLKKAKENSKLKAKNKNESRSSVSENSSMVMEEIHPKMPYPFNCWICVRGFFKVSTYLNHIKKVHPSLYEEERSKHDQLNPRKRKAIEEKEDVIIVKKAKNGTVGKVRCPKQHNGAIEKKSDKQVFDKAEVLEKMAHSIETLVDSSEVEEETDEEVIESSSDVESEVKNHRSTLSLDCSQVQRCDNSKTELSSRGGSLKKPLLETCYDYVCLFCGYGVYKVAAMKQHLLRKHSAVYTTDLEKCDSFKRKVIAPRAVSPANDAPFNENEDGRRSSGRKRIISTDVAKFLKGSGRSTKLKREPKSEIKQKTSKEISDSGSSSENESVDDCTVFMCKMCDLLLSTSALLYAHKKSHTKSLKKDKENFSKLRCTVCSSLVPRHNLKWHMHTEHANEKLNRKKTYCRLCNYASRVNLSKHIASNHPELLRIECRLCDTRFSESVSYERHFQETHANSIDEDALHCFLCNKNFEDLPSLHTHYSIVHMNKNADLHCLACTKYFYKEDDLKKHNIEFHQNQRFQCGLCMTEFDHVESCEKHVVEHKQSTAFKCSTCNFFFSGQDSLDKHVVYHKDQNSDLKAHSVISGMKQVKENRTMNVCKGCGESFTRVEIFDAHEKACCL